MAKERNEEYKSTNYELFILALSILSIVNWGLYFIIRDEDMLQVVIAVDLVLSVIFLGDFLYRLFTAESKRGYFIRQYGWLDFLSSLPFPQAKIARLGRVIRAFRLMREYGTRDMIREFLYNRAGTAMLAVIFLIILVLEFGSIAIVYAERSSPNANITTSSDALWWTIVTIATVGYGDTFPTTNIGRAIGVLVIIVGVGLFGVVTGFLANKFLTPTKHETKDRKDQAAESHSASEAILEEIKRLRMEQEKTNAEFSAKLEALSTQLARTDQ
jgi:voltage-gated potassium channel Kch